MKQTPKRKRLLAFLPAAVIIGVVAGTAAGISILPSATAANIDVTGSVNATLDIPANPTTGPGVNDGSAGQCTASGANAAFTVAAGWENAATRLGTCRIDFGSTTGAIQLTFENGNANTLAGSNNGAAVYCNSPGGTGRNCTNAVDRVSNVAGGGQPISADTFGIALDSTPVNAVGGSDVTEALGSPADTNTNSEADLGESLWYPVPAAAAADQLCRTSAAGTGACVFRLGLRGKGVAPAQNNGNYSGRVVLTAAQL